MAELSIAIEAQYGLTWQRWRKIVTAVEALGFDALFRNQRTLLDDGEIGVSIDLWTSLTFALMQTHRVAVGALTASLDYQHPAQIARQTASLIDLSNGRFMVGVGATEHPGEASAFGLPTISAAQVQEGIAMVDALLRAKDPISYEGLSYKLDRANIMPLPAHRPTMMIYGNDLHTAARHADYWVSDAQSPYAYKLMKRKFNSILTTEGRDPNDIKYGMLVDILFAKNTRSRTRMMEVAKQRFPETSTLYDDEVYQYVRGKGILIGSPNQIVEQIAELTQAGLQSVILRWSALDDINALEIMAARVLPQVRAMKSGY